MSYASDRHPVYTNLAAYDDPVSFHCGEGAHALTDAERAAMVAWIVASFAAARTTWKRANSYGMKHYFETSPGGFYVTNGQFKGAMLAAGFAPVKVHEQNWRFRIRPVKARKKMTP